MRDDPRFRLAILVAAALLSICSTAFSQDSSDPRELWRHASVYRDEWGAPHVYAENVRAMAFAFGYAQAEDHLEPMLMAYRIANGRAAEVAGETCAASDEFSLKMGHAMLARNAFAQADPVTRDLCEGFALGANTWLVEHPDRVPPWAEGVKPEDILALLHCYLMSMAPFDLPDTWHRGPGTGSANAWAVAPAKSDNGRALLVINPHADYNGPFQWYEAHLVCPDINMSGATLFGLPALLQGHTPILGWALSPNQPDFADFYIESSLNFSREDQKKINKRLGPVEDKVLDALLLANSRPYYVNTPNGVVERSVPCFDTRRGPVIGTNRGRMCSWRIGGYHDFGALAQLFEMARAADLESFQAALAMRQLPCFHIVYADQAGNIAYVYNATMCIKPAAKVTRPKDAGEENETPPAVIDWTTPQAAEDSACNWGDPIPLAEMPALVNPASGYVQACGTPPWAATENDTIKPENLPRWFCTDRDTFRAQRVRRLLAMGKRSFRDCQSMLYDTVVPYAMDAVPHLLKSAEDRPDFIHNAHPDLALGIDLLKSWNYLADTNSAAMTFFEAWWTSVRANNPMPDGVLYQSLLTDPQMQDAELSAAADAARLLRNDFQSLTIPWGDVHTVRRGEKEIAVAGAAAGEPLFTTGDFVYDSRKWPVTYGYGYAMVVEFGDQPQAVTMVPFGASENAASPHYADQLDLLAQRRFKLARFNFDDVQRNASGARGRVLYLRPKGVEAMFTLEAESPVEARVTAQPDCQAKLPEGLAPFTLYMALEQAPRSVPVTATLDVYIPPVLCSREDLQHVALYACGSDLVWTKLEQQDRDAEARTLRAVDASGPRIYAALGGEQYRAQRIDEPAEQKTLSQLGGGGVLEIGAPPKPPETDSANLPLAPQLPVKKLEIKRLEGVPPPHEQKKIDLENMLNEDEKENPQRFKQQYQINYGDWEMSSGRAKERDEEQKRVNEKNEKILRKAGLLPPEPKHKKKKGGFFKNLFGGDDKPKQEQAVKQEPVKTETKSEAKTNFTGRKK